MGSWLRLPRRAPPEQLDLLSYRPQKFYVYVIENTVNDKVYVGKATDVDRRWKHHQYVAKSGASDQALYRAMRKHGIDKFSIRTIHECATEEEAYRMEAVFVERLNSMIPPHGNGYNMTTGGLGGCAHAGGWATEDEFRAFASGMTVSQYEVARRGNHRMPCKSMIPDIYGKNFAELAHGIAYGEWVPEDVLRAKIQGVSAAEYDRSRKSWGRGYPQRAWLPTVYGKNFTQIRDGESWASVEEVRQRMADWAEAHGHLMRAKDYESARKEWGPRFPSTAYFQRVYGMSLAEVRDGIRGTNREWASVDVIRAMMAAWAAKRGRPITMAEYDAERAEWGANFPCSSRFERVLGVTFAEARDGRRRGRMADLPEIREWLAAWEAREGRLMLGKEWDRHKPAHFPAFSSFQETFGASWVVAIFGDGAKARRSEIARLTNLARAAARMTPEQRAERG
jgi:predicted GIY-YIG superfamily endonuclease